MQLRQVTIDVYFYVCQSSGAVVGLMNILGLLGIKMVIYCNFNRFGIRFETNKV